MMKKAIPLLLFLLLSGTAGWAQYKPLTVPDLPNLEVRRVERARQDSLRMGNLPPVERRAVAPPERSLLQISRFPEVQHRRVVAPEISKFIGPQLPRVELLSIAEFKDFKGGLNLSSYKTKVAPNQAIVLENALWNEQGEMYKRPGYDTLKTTPEVFNFLYRYYQQDGDKYLMGGSDTALYFWEEDSTVWTYLIGTEGTSGRWDGTTFEDMFVGTHEGIEPIVWNGENLYTSFTDFADTFVVEKSNYILVDDSTMTFCHRDTHIIKIPDTQGSWESNEWDAYTVRYPLVYYSPFPEDTIYRYDLVSGNNERCLYFTPGFNPSMSAVSNTSPNNKFQVLSIFGVDSVWREGMADSVIACEDLIADQIRGVGLPWRNVWECINQVGTTRYGYDHYFAKIFDDTFAWDSTFNYDDYIFEVTDGAGLGSKCYLGQYFRTSEDLNYGWSNSLWNTSAFFVYAYSAECFDSTTEYRIYAPIADQQGAKFVENFDARLWLGWTGLGEEQNKNAVIYSKLEDMGNWPPENDVYLTPDDGDWITGMKSLSDARHVDVPSHLLMVSKNASSYKITPTSTAGLYDSWYISTRVGCVSNSAMSVGEGLVLFPDQSGVWAWDQRSKPQSVSLLIDPIFEDLALENLEDASAIYNPQDRHYYISLPTRVDTVYNGDFIVTFRRDSSFYEDQCVHLITTLDGEQGGDVVIVEDSSSNYCDIAADTLGNYCVLIRELYDLFLFRYDSLNAEVGARIKVTDEAGKVTMSPIHLDMNNNGRIIAVWEDWRDDELFGTPDVYGQCLDFTDGKVGSNFPVNVDYLTNQDGGGNGSTYPSVAINDDSVCVIVWQTWDDPGAPATCIYAAMDTFPVSFSSLSYFEPEENCGSSYSRWWPDVDAGDTTFVVVYMNDDWLKGYVVHATYNYDLDVINSGTIGQPDDVTGSAYPSVAMNKEGRFVVSWWHVVGLNSNTIWARKYDVGGVASGSYFRVDNTTDVMFTVYPDVAINELDQYCIVWGDARITGTGATTHNYYKCYTWDGGAVSSDSFLNDMVSATYGQPEITLGPTWVEYDTTKHTFAWSIDYHGWSEESFDASTYCYQHGLTDPVKVLFADPEETKVYNYGTQADDVNDAVILTYQSPYLSFTEYPYWENFLRYVTVEAYLGTGTIYLDFYVDYSTLVYQDSILCGTDCREEIQLPDSLYGKNLSIKVRTGSTIDEFYLSKYWWEYNLKKERD